MPCQLCEREVSKLTRHHLIPVTRHKNKKTKKDFSSEEVKETIRICRPCHSNIHCNFTEKELERDLRTLETLKVHPDIQKFSQWINSKPDGFRVQFKESKSKK